MSTGVSRTDASREVRSAVPELYAKLNGVDVPITKSDKQNPWQAAIAAEMEASGVSEADATQTQMVPVGLPAVCGLLTPVILHGKL